MRIFTFVSYNFGFSEWYCQKLAKDRAKYILSIKPSLELLTAETGQSDVENSNLALRSLILGFKPTASSKDSLEVRAFRSKKLRIKKASEFRVLETFNKSIKDTPIPLVYIYKKKPKAKDKLSTALIKLLSCYYIKLVNYYENLQANLSVASDPQAVDVLKAGYTKQIKALGEALFSELKKQFASIIEVHGILLDQFFITEQQAKLYLEDTLHLPNMEKKSLNTVLENNNEFGFVVSQTSEEVSSDSLSEIDVNFSGEYKNSSQASIESVVKIQNCAEPDKVQAERLILDYQKHLSKSYFFRCKKVGKEKFAHTERLVDALHKESLGKFIEITDEFAKKGYLSQHRDKFFIQKIGRLFKGHNKSEGSQLIESLQTMIENELTC